jgi:hypothetical protein
LLAASCTHRGAWIQGDHGKVGGERGRGKGNIVVCCGLPELEGGNF